MTTTRALFIPTASKTLAEDYLCPDDVIRVPVIGHVWRVTAVTSDNNGGAFVSARCLDSNAYGNVIMTFFIAPKDKVTRYREQELPEGAVVVSTMRL